MDLSTMISQEMDGRAALEIQHNGAQEEQAHSHHYPTRRSMSSNAMNESRNLGSLLNDDPQFSSNTNYSNQPPKTVSFELLFDGVRNDVRGRLPMRVQIYQHDNTESIIASVKSFFGLYDPQGVSFEDSDGNTMIASYDNFLDNTTVPVRVVPDYSSTSTLPATWSQRVNELEEPVPMLPPQPAQILNYGGQPPSRPMSRVSRKQSTSPKPSQGRSSGNSKSRPRSGLKSQASSFQAGLDELNDSHNGYSSSDGVAGSVSGSRKARSEQLTTAEISVDNIVEGGRRKRPKFESSELPLFVPPQVPAPNSISSLSPQRRSNGVDMASPFAKPPQRTFTYNVPLQSPQGDGYVGSVQGVSQAGSPFQVPPVPSHGHRLRDRSSGASVSNRSSLGSGNWQRGHNILPTPDPTIASCISDEDVALQLMRLGDASNFSHGRTSASTFDDGLSGRADAASSATSNSDDESDATEEPTLPTSHPRIKAEPNVEPSGRPAKKQRTRLTDAHPSTDSTEPSGDEVDGDYEDASSKVESNEQEQREKPKVSRGRKGKTTTKPVKLPKQIQPSANKAKQPPVPGFQTPMSPASLPTQSRKTSLASANAQQLGPDEDDLSTKPRCQRCRKSKKGCDRQRPCQRCKDAGIGIEGCISEDEGNGRKGRYGRYMGTPVIKKTIEPATIDNESEAAGAILSGMASGQATAAGNKKRKR